VNLNATRAARRRQWPSLSIHFQGELLTFTDPRARAAPGLDQPLGAENVERAHDRRSADLEFVGESAFRGQTRARPQPSCDDRGAQLARNLCIAPTRPGPAAALHVEGYAEHRRVDLHHSLSAHRINGGTDSHGPALQRNERTFLDERKPTSRRALRRVRPVTILAARNRPPPSAVWFPKGRERGSGYAGVGPTVFVAVPAGGSDFRQQEAWRRTSSASARTTLQVARRLEPALDRVSPLCERSGT
jgi:hypothetical protein